MVINVWTVWNGGSDLESTDMKSASSTDYIKQSQNQCFSLCLCFLNVSCECIPSEWQVPYMVREGNRNCRSFLFFTPSQACPYLVYGRRRWCFHRTDITDEPFLGCGSSIVLPSLLLLQSSSSRGVSSIFRNECRVGVLSQGCLSSHITAEAFTDRAIVKEERMSGTTLVSPRRESCSGAVVPTLTALCKSGITEWNRARASFPLPAPSFVLSAVLSDKQQHSP